MRVLINNPSLLKTGCDKCAAHWGNRGGKQCHATNRVDLFCPRFDLDDDTLRIVERQP
jgi:hypothetical protein